MKMISIISMALLLVGPCIAAPSYTDYDFGHTVNGRLVAPPFTYDDFAQTVKGIYFVDTNAQILTHGNEVEIYVTNPQENATAQGIKELEERVVGFGKDLSYQYNNITTVTAHVEFAYKNETRHYTYIFTPKYILPGQTG